MGQAQSRIDARHIGIYQKLLAIQNPATRLQMIDTLMGDPGIIQSAKIAGIYANILQVSAAIRHGGPIPLLPGESQAHQGQHPQQGQLAYHPGAFQARQPTVSNKPSNQLVTTTAPQQSYYQQVSKPKRSEKALNFFTACLRVLGIQEEISLTEETLKLAYKRAVMKAHPDKGGSKEAFDAVTRAYAYLIDILKLVKGSSGSKGQEAVPELNTVHEQRTSASQEWQMPAEPVKLNPKSLNLTVFNQMFEQTRIPDPDEDGYGDWLKDDEKGTNQKKRVKGKNFSEDFNREVFNRMFEEENASGKGGQGQVIRFNHPQELILSQGSGVELGRDRPPDYTAAYDSGLQFTDLRAAYTKENTVTEKVSNVKVENRDFNSYKSQRERAPDMYSREEMAALNAHEIQQKQREEQRRLRAAQEHVGARDYFERMKQLVIAEK